MISKVFVSGKDFSVKVDFPNVISISLTFYFLQLTHLLKNA